MNICRIGARRLMIEQILCKFSAVLYALKKTEQIRSFHTVLLYASEQSQTCSPVLLLILVQNSLILWFVLLSSKKYSANLLLNFIFALSVEQYDQKIRFLLCKFSSAEQNRPSAHILLCFHRRKTNNSAKMFHWHSP